MTWESAAGGGGGGCCQSLHFFLWWGRSEDKATAVPYAKGFQDPWVLRDLKVLWPEADGDVSFCLLQLSQGWRGVTVLIRQPWPDKPCAVSQGVRVSSDGLLRRRGGRSGGRPQRVSQRVTVAAPLSRSRHGL